MSGPAPQCERPLSRLQDCAFLGPGPSSSSLGSPAGPAPPPPMPRPPLLTPPLPRLRRKSGVADCPLLRGSRLWAPAGAVPGVRLTPLRAPSSHSVLGEPRGAAPRPQPPALPQKRVRTRLSMLALQRSVARPGGRCRDPGSDRAGEAQVRGPAAGAGDLAGRRGRGIWPAGESQPDRNWKSYFNVSS